MFSKNLVISKSLWHRKKMLIAIISDSSIVTFVILTSIYFNIHENFFFLAKVLALNR